MNQEAFEFLTNDTPIIPDIASIINEYCYITKFNEHFTCSELNVRRRTNKKLDVVVYGDGDDSDDYSYSATKKIFKNEFGSEYVKHNKKIVYSLFRFRQHEKQIFEVGDIIRDDIGDDYDDCFVILKKTDKYLHGAIHYGCPHVDIIKSPLFKDRFDREFTILDTLDNHTIVYPPDTLYKKNNNLNDKFKIGIKYISLSPFNFFFTFLSLKTVNHRREGLFIYYSKLKPALYEITPIVIDENEGIETISGLLGYNGYDARSDTFEKP